MICQLYRGGQFYWLAGFEIRTLVVKGTDYTGSSTVDPTTKRSQT